MFDPWQDTKAGNAHEGIHVTVSRDPTWTRLTDREQIAVDTALQPTDLIARLLAAIDDHHSIEMDPTLRSRRSLSGSIDGSSVRLVVYDDNMLTRKKSWNVEFNGNVVETSQGSTIRGVIEVPDRSQLSLMIRFLSIGAILVVAIAVGLTVRAVTSGGALDLAPLIVTMVVSFFAVIALFRMEREGESAAGDDASLLDAFLRRLLA